MQFTQNVPNCAMPQISRLSKLPPLKTCKNPDQRMKEKTNKNKFCVTNNVSVCKRSSEPILPPPPQSRYIGIHVDQSGSFNEKKLTLDEMIRIISNVEDRSLQRHQIQKIGILKELCSQISSPFSKNRFSFEQIQKVFEAVRLNIASSIRPKLDCNNIYADEIATQRDSCLFYIYQLLLRILHSNGDMGVGDDFLNQLFILMNTTHNEERSIVIKILKCFCKIKDLWKKTIQDMVHKYISYHFQYTPIPYAVIGLVELEKLFIENPTLSQKNKNCMIKENILPFLKDKYVSIFSAPLEEYINSCVEDNPELCNDILVFMNRHWPVWNSRKNELFIRILIQILQFIVPRNFAFCANSMFKRLSQYLVVQTASNKTSEYIFSNQQLAKHLKYFSSIIIGNLYEALLLSESEGIPLSPSLKNALEAMKALDLKAYNKILSEFNENQSEKNNAKKHIWFTIMKKTKGVVDQNEFLRYLNIAYAIPVIRSDPSNKPIQWAIKSKSLSYSDQTRIPA